VCRIHLFPNRSRWPNERVFNPSILDRHFCDPSDRHDRSVGYRLVARLISRVLAAFALTLRENAQLHAKTA
jgi:hypothetical protein